jgi:unsaturated chondroitin disaccharide hydrolase
MMDLEILFEASKQSMNQTWHNIAWQHANRTMYENFRPDNSTYHMIEYNETDGSVIRKYTAQGYADWSTWSRGQAWGTYGFTMAYRYTKYQPFLDKAIAAANYFLSRLPSATDLIPYWDFDSPFNSTIPYQPRDTSAAAILASGLIELSEYVMDSDLKTRYLNSSKAIIAQLSTPKYLLNGNKDYKLPALLANGTHGPYPSKPYDVALSFGDYYFVEAAVRLSKL